MLHSLSKKLIANWRLSVQPNMDLLEFCTFWTIVAILLAYYILSQPKASKRFKDLENCERIRECRGIYDEPNLISPLQARALPNRRIAEVFHLENAFTTMDNGDYKEFRKVAASKISITSDKWIHVADHAKMLVRNTVTNDHQRRFRLLPLVQTLSLKITLYILFDKDPLHLDNKHVSSIAYAINELWEESKHRISSEHIQSLQGSLQKAILGIFPGQSLAPRDTPMNLIIPAYETLWRVVLRLFLEVSFRNLDAAPGWRQALHIYLEDQTKFRSRLNAQSVPPSFLVDEALRLYPPTRRLYRMFQLGPNSETMTVSADVEACQRKPDIWGPRSFEFFPQRWENISEEARKTFTPFGGKTFTCPAKQEFGPRVIGVLVAALTEYITAENWDIESEAKEDIFSREPLSSNRRAHGSIFVTAAHRALKE